MSDKKPRWTFWKIFFGSIFLVVLIAGSMATWRYYRTSQEIEMEIDKIRDAGEPVKFRDLEARLPRPDPAVNADRFYQAGINLQIYREDMDVYFLRLNAHADNKTQPESELFDNISKYLDENKLALEMLDKGRDLDECCGEPLTSYNFRTAYSTLSKIKGAVRLISLRSKYLAASGKMDEAVDSIVSSLRLARICDNQAMNASLTKVACWAVAYEDVKYALQRGNISEKSLVKLQNELWYTDQPEECEKMLLHERVYGINTYGILPRDEYDPMAYVNTHSQYDISKLWSKSKSLEYLRNMSNYIEIARKPWPRLFDDMKSAHLKDATGYFQVATAYGRNLATVRAVHTAAAIERYRLKHKILPEKLSELVPEFMDSVPVDPFTGRDFIYHADNDSYTVYSIGDDKTDDGGNVIPGKQVSNKSTNGFGGFGGGVGFGFGSSMNTDWGVRIDIVQKDLRQ